MACQKCGYPLEPEARFCPQCGTQVVKAPPTGQTQLNITPAEGKNGCQKIVQAPGLSAPLRVTLQPGIRDGQILAVNNAVFSREDGKQETGVLYVTVRIRKKRKVWIPAVAGAAALIFFVVGLFVLWPRPQEEEPDPEAVEQLLEDLNDLQEQWTDENGYVPEEDLEDCLEEALQVLEEEDTVTYCEKNGDNVYFECEDGYGYVFMPEREDYAAGGDELQIVTVQPYYTENLRLDTMGKYDHDALDSVAMQIGEQYSMWSFDNDGGKNDDNVDDRELSIERMLSLDDYKLILWQGHGGYTKKRGYVACTTIEVTKEMKKEYKELFQKKYITISLKGTLYFTEAFFENAFPDNAFDGAVFYIGTCLSGYTKNFANILLDKGAAAVYVNSDNIWRDYNLQMIRSVGENLCRGDTITQALENAKATNGASRSLEEGEEVYVYCVAKEWAKKLTLQQLAYVSPMTEYKEAYINLLISEVLPYASADMPYRSYTLYDIDLDGVPECIVEYGTSEADRSYRIYTAYGAAYAYLGTVTSSHSTLYGEEKGGLTVMSGQMGTETCRTISMEDWEAVETVVYSRRVDDYWHERCYMQPLSMYDLADFAGLIWNGNPGYDNRSELMQKLPEEEEPAIEPPAVEPPTAAMPDYEVAYRALWLEQEPVMGGSDVSIRYTLYDMDLDGIPECIIETGWSEADKFLDVYTAVGTQAVYLGSFGGSHSIFYGEISGGLTVLSGYMGVETCKTVTIAGGAVQETVLYMAEVDTYWNELCQMRPLVMYDLFDEAGLAWRGNPNYDNWAALSQTLGRIYPDSSYEE